MTDENTHTQDYLRISSLSYEYGESLLLADINFSLAPGEILALLGPSGSGKTTLLRIIAGLECDYTGDLRLAGRDLRQIVPYRRNFGMMFQEYALFPHLNVMENVLFGLRQQNLSEPEMTTRAKAMLELVGLQDLSLRSTQELSGGERQRVALARSLAPEPKLLLLDEPLGSLDRSLRDHLARRIRAILKELGVAAIFVTHDQSEAFSVADRMAILQNGHLQQLDTPERIYLSPANRAVAGFLGFTNIFPCRCTEDGRIATSIGALPGPIQGNDAVRSLLIRPDSARIVAESRSGHLMLKGKVTERWFQGESYRLKLQVNAEHLVFTLPLEPPPPQAGAGITLQLNPAGLVLLED